MLAGTAYGNLAFRSFCDLDILMQRDDIIKAKDVLLIHNYQPSLRLTANQENAYLRTHHDYKFISPSRAFVVELQWGVTEWSFAFHFDFAEVWDRCESVSLAGVTALNMNVEDQLLTLCVHGTKHRWQQLKWISDIGELVDSYRDSINWDRLLAQSRKLGGERMLLLGLCLAHDLLGTVLPNPVLERVSGDSKGAILAQRVSYKLFPDADAEDTLLDEKPFFYWHARERLRDKLLLLWKYLPEYIARLVVPNERDRAFWRAPSYLNFSYYLVRPARLLWEQWLGVLRWRRRLDK
jgi:hypothetical protein